MKIAIIGAGNVGGGLATAATKAGHDVVLSAGDAASAQASADAAGAAAAASNVDAVQGADLVVLATTGKWNGQTFGGNNLSNGVCFYRVEPKAGITDPTRYSDPTEGGQPLDAFIAADDDVAKTAVSSLAESLGYRVIDAGGLRMARSLEEMAFLNISLNATNGWSWQSGWKLVGPTAGA